jgi:hypothetical protein
MAECPDLADIPKNETLEQGWESRGNDRRAYSECRNLNSAKANVIRSLNSSQIKG